MHAMRKRHDLTSPNTNIASSSSAPERLNGSYIESVRQRAYELYEMRLGSNSPGDPLTDWLTAEEQVRTKLAHEDDIHAT